MTCNRVDYYSINKSNDLTYDNSCTATSATVILYETMMYRHLFCFEPNYHGDIINYYRHVSSSHKIRTVKGNATCIDSIMMMCHQSAVGQGVTVLCYLHFRSVRRGVKIYIYMYRKDWNIHLYTW